MRFAACLILCSLLIRAAWAGPSGQDRQRAVPFLPPGFTLTDVVRGFGGERIAIMTNGDQTRLVVLPGATGAGARWFVTRTGTRNMPAPIQGGAGEKMHQLVYPATVAGQPLLYVTCYLADVYTLLVFKPGRFEYKEIFETNSMETPRFDRRTGRLTVTQIGDNDSEGREYVYVWANGSYVKRKR